MLRGEYKCPSYISREAQHLLRRMLCVDPQRRYTMTDCLSHSWTEMSFKPQRQNFGGGFPSSDLYMKRLVSWIRHNDNDTRRPGQQDHWWWHMADVQPVPPGSQAGSTLVPTDARTATADHRLYQVRRPVRSASPAALPRPLRLLVVLPSVRCAVRSGCQSPRPPGRWHQPEVARAAADRIDRPMRPELVQRTQLNLVLALRCAGPS